MALDPGRAGHFLKRQLEQVLPKLYEKRYPRLWSVDSSEILPGFGDLDPGTETLIEETINTAGEAVIYSDKSGDIPTADANIEEFPYKAVMLASAVAWSVAEMNADEKANRNLRANKLFALNRAMMEKKHKLAVFGSAKHGMEGLFNNSNVPVVTSTYDANTATFQDHIDFFSDSFSQVEDSTNLTEGIATVLVTERHHKALVQSVLPGTSTSALTYILDNYSTSAGGTLQRIMKVNETRAALLEQFGVLPPGTNNDRVVFLPMNPDAVERRFYDTSFLDIQMRALSLYLYAYCGVSETIVHYPTSMLYVDITQVL